MITSKKKITMDSKYFKRSEFACRCGCGFDTVDAELLDVLEDMRSQFERPVFINSGCRCQEYNASIGGAINSQHMYARAADIVVDGVSPYDVYKYFTNKYPGLYGIGSYYAFTHVDTRSYSARW